MAMLTKSVAAAGQGEQSAVEARGQKGSRADLASGFPRAESRLGHRPAFLAEATGAGVGQLGTPPTGPILTDLIPLEVLCS